MHHFGEALFSTSRSNIDGIIISFLQFGAKCTKCGTNACLVGVCSVHTSLERWTRPCRHARRQTCSCITTSAGCCVPTTWSRSTAFLHASFDDASLMPRSVPVAMVPQKVSVRQTTASWSGYRESGSISTSSLRCTDPATSLLVCDANTPFSVATAALYIPHNGLQSFLVGGHWAVLWSVHPSFYMSHLQDGCIVDRAPSFGGNLSFCCAIPCCCWYSCCLSYGSAEFNGLQPLVCCFNYQKSHLAPFDFGSAMWLSPAFWFCFWLCYCYCFV